MSKANKALGLLIRSFQTGLPKQKLNRKALMAAYCANVRSILEYGSVVWSGAAKTHLKRLERIQHKFLLWLAARAGGADRPASLEYSHLLSFFNILSLEARRTKFDLLYLRNIFSGGIDSSFLLSCFALHVPSRMTRKINLFSVPYARVATVKAGTFVRLVADANDFMSQYPQVDFFADSSSAFKSLAVAYCSNL